MKISSVLLFGFMLVGKVYAADSVYVESISGTNVNIIDQSNSTAASEGAEVKAGQHVKTGANSNVGLIFPDGSRLILSHDSELEIDSPINGAHSSQLIDGTLQAVIEKAPAKKANHKFYIRTSTAVMGVRGTEFIVDHSVGNSELQVHTMEGQVDVAKDLKSLRAGQGVPLKSGEAITSNRQGLAAKSSFNIKEYREQIKKQHPGIYRMRNLVSHNKLKPNGGPQALNKKTKAGSEILKETKLRHERRH